MKRILGIALLTILIVIVVSLVCIAVGVPKGIFVIISASVFAALTVLAIKWIVEG